MSNCNDGCLPNQFPTLCPAPIPPWARPAGAQSPLYQLLTGPTIAITLGQELTYLAQVNPTPPASPIVNNMTLPNGNYITQYKRMFIPEQIRVNSSTWVVAGAYAGGFTTLTFNPLGFSAILEWDGSAWQMLAGNAILGP